MRARSEKWEYSRVLVVVVTSSFERMRLLVYLLLTVSTNASWDVAAVLVGRILTSDLVPYLLGKYVE